MVYADKITHTFKENGEWKKSEINLQNPQNLIYLSVSRVFGLYKSQALREGDKPLPAATVEYYLKNSPAFICDTKKVYFKKFDAKNGYPELDEKGNKKFTYTSAFVFYLDKLNLNIAEEHLNGEDWGGKKIKTEGFLNKKQKPFLFAVKIKFYHAKLVTLVTLITLKIG